MQFRAPTLDDARALIRAGQPAEALLLINRLAAANDGDALITLAEWRWLGKVLSQDFVKGRDFYRRAGEAGKLQGAIAYTNLLANGIAGPADWRTALGRLEGEAQRDKSRRRILDLVRKMDLDDEGDPASAPVGKLLSEAPYVMLFPGLLSAAECDYLTRLAEPGFKPSVVINQETGETFRDPIRTSEGSTVHWLIEDPAVHAINRRLAAASGTHVDQGEPLQILRYRPGQEYKPHYDAVAGFTNQRMLTALSYLNEQYTGWETFFSEVDLKIRGQKGDVLVFRNILDNGRFDPASRHQGMPVVKGVKYLGSRWIRERPRALASDADPGSPQAW
jgi:prolyl 4-hydroxylase